MYVEANTKTLNDGEAGDCWVDDVEGARAILAQQVEDSVEEQLSEINWVAKLQLTELPVTLEDEDGYDEALEMYNAFHMAHDQVMEDARKVLVETTNLFVQGKELDKKRIKKYENYMVAKARGEERARERRIKKLIKVDPKLASRVTRAKDRRMANVNTIKQAWDDYLSSLSGDALTQAKAEYNRLTTICLMVSTKAMKKVMSR